MNMKQLNSAIRQYKHNDGSDGFIFGYDKIETEKLVNELNAQIEFKIKECQELAQACSRYKAKLHK
jgi:hypothetical protein